MTDNDIIKALKDYAEKVNHAVFFQVNENGAKELYKILINTIAIINLNAAEIIRLQAESKNQSQNFKVLCSDHRCLQQSFDNLKDLYEAEKAKVEKAKEKSIYFAKELQKAKSELKEITEKFNCQQIVYADLSDIIREKNAEIERLQTSVVYDVNSFASEYDSKIKAEAIKEFAERLKENTVTVKIGKQTCKVITIDGINYLVKEMTNKESSNIINSDSRQTEINNKAHSSVRSFAEKLKYQLSLGLENKIPANVYSFVYCTVDNLVNEMVGDAE